MSQLRAATARALADVLEGRRTLDDAVARQESSVDARDRAMLRQLCFGSCRWFHQLDGLTRPLLKKPFKARDTDLYALLLSGAYQLLHMRIPDHAAINETVSATRALKKEWASGLVNGVLRNISRDHETQLGMLPPHAQRAHPKWLMKRIFETWPEHAEQIVEANNQQPPMTLRVNALKTTRERWLEKAAAESIDATQCPLSVDGVTLVQPCAIEKLPGFAEGEVSVQDESAQLGVGLLDCKPGDRVLDACAAPGGKTGHLLERFPDIALTAMDLNSARLQRVEENLQRLALTATCMSGDAAAPEGWWDGTPFDAILLDAPCSGSGVIRRHPDIKILRKPEQIDTLRTQQSAILNGIWQCLRPGGKLVYITCSILPEENERVVADFIEHTPDAVSVAMDTNWGIATALGRQLLPTPSGGDGFYFALIEKTH